MGILLNIVLFLGKFLIGNISGSMAITADAWNNVLDAGNATIALLGIKIAGCGKGEKHPFGHGRMEWMVSLFSSMIVILAGYELLQISWESIRNPKDVTVSFVVLLILIASIIVKLYMFIHYKNSAKKKDSETMKAMSVDSLCDSIATATVLFSTIVNAAFGWRIDGWCGMIVSVFIIYTGYSSIKETSRRIVGRAPDQELVDKVEMIVKQYEVIQNIQEMTIHDYGIGRFMVVMKIEVYKQENSALIKYIPEDISHILYQQLGCDSMIQMNYLVKDENEKQIYSEIVEEIKKIDEVIPVQNFRIVQAEKYKIIHVDISLPIKLEKREDEIRKMIEDRICKVNQEYVIVIKFKIMHNHRMDRKIKIKSKMEKT
ncbi:MAG: cation diffusion facilitator family transporter [Lachnotalea sp.]